MTARRLARRRRACDGWRVVAGAFLVVMAGFGAIYSYAAFAEEIAGAFGASAVSVAFVYALSGGTCFLVSALSGPLADRLGPRVPALAGMMLVGLGLVVAATASSLVEIYAGYGLLIGLGTGFAYVPAMAAVQRWFTTHRGLASGIAASGIGVGTALVPPAAAAFQAWLDWRPTFVAFGCLVAVVGGLGALLLEPRGRRGPGGARDAGEGARVPAPLTAAVRSPAFARAWAGTLLVSIPATLPHAMLAGTAREAGLARADALALLGLIGLGTIAGRFLIAAVADAIGRRATFLACCAGMSGSTVIWALAEDAAALQAFALAFGALQGGFVALLPAFGADTFGARSVGGVLGLLYTSRGVALLLAPPLVAALLAAVGHGVPLLAAAALGAAGSLMLARVPRLPDGPPRGALPAPGAVARRALPVAALLGAILAGGAARAADGFVATELLWSVPAARPGAPAACARLLVLNLPHGWQTGDAAAVVMAPEGRGFDAARPLVALLLAQQTAVLELPEGRGGGIGACATAPVDRPAQLLGALAALRTGTGAGVVVAFGLGEAGPAAIAAAREEVAAPLLGPGGPRFAFGVALRDGLSPLFQPGAPPPAEERWADRAPHLCAMLHPFIGGQGAAACRAAALEAAR